MPNSVNSLLAADYAIIAGFFVLMLAIGFYFAGRMRNMSDYFAGGRRVPWWLSSISYWMTSFSAFAFVAHSALAYKHGLVPVTMWYLSAAALIVAAHVAAARWRRVATTSPMEFIEERFGPGMRQGLSWLGSVLIVLDDATKIVAIGAVVSASLGFPSSDAILWCGLIMLTYTLLGGLWAVLITDTVQFVIILVAVIVLAPLALVAVGGVGGFLQNAPADTFSFSGGKYTWPYIGLLICFTFLSYTTRWSLVQRFYAVPTDKDARKVCYLAAALNIIFAPLVIFPAIAAAVFLPGIEDPDQVYGLVCRELLPVGMLGMLIAAIFSATMSSLSGDYNAVASVLTNDVYKRLFVKSASDRHYVMAGRGLTLLVGLATVGIALSMEFYGKNLLLFDIMVMIFVLFGPPTTLPVLAGLLFRRVSNGGAICGMATGLVASFIALCCGEAILAGLYGILNPLFGLSLSAAAPSEAVLMAVGLAATVFGLVLGSLIWQGGAAERKKVSRFLDGMRGRETVVPQAAAPGGSAISPLPIIGLAVALLGGLLALAVLFTAPSGEGVLSIIVGLAMVLLGGVMIAVHQINVFLAGKKA